MHEIQIIRTNSEHPDFVALVRLLDADLSVKDGEDHAFFSQFNKIVGLNEVVIAQIDGLAVGCGAFKPYAEGVVEIKRMFVLPEYRGKGVAMAVLSALETWAAELNCHACVLETGFKMTEAIGLYQKLGYERIENYGQYIGIAASRCFQKTLIKI
jgi:putative acetyltransferase